LLRQPELAAERPDLVFEELPDGLDELEVQVLRQSAHVVVTLDGRRRSADGGGALDHVRVERALCQELDIPQLSRFLGEYVDKHFADGLALLFGVSDVLESVQEELLGPGHVQINAEDFTEHFLNLFGLAVAKDPVVHEDAVQPVADGPVQEHGHNG